MEKITHVNITARDVIEGSKYPCYVLITPETELNDLDSVLAYLKKLIETKLEKTAIQLNTLLSTSEQTQMYIHLMNVNALAREIAIYYILQFLIDDAVDEDLIKQETDFILNHFDLQAILDNFSNVQTFKLEGIVLAVDFEGSEDVFDPTQVTTLPYTINREIVSNIVVNLEDKDHIVGHLPEYPESNAPQDISDNKEGK